jgi:hypothetical protein
MTKTQELFHRHHQKIKAIRQLSLEADETAKELLEVLDVGTYVWEEAAYTVSIVGSGKKVLNKVFIKPVP